MAEGAELVAGFRAWQNVADDESNFPGFLDEPLFANLASGYFSDLVGQYQAEPDLHDVYNCLTNLLLTLAHIKHNGLDVGEIRQADRVFDQYRKDQLRAAALLREAAMLQQLPPDYYTKHSPDLEEPQFLTVGSDDNWQRHGGGLLVHRPTIGEKERSLIGRRGRASDDVSATRGASIRALNEALPKNIDSRNAVIAALLGKVGVKASRQLVSSTLKKGRT